MVRIFIDGIEYPVPKRIFQDMMYAAENQADQWFYNNEVQGNDELASIWCDLAERARNLKVVVEESRK